MRSLVLASRSPRRVELLRKAGYEVVCHPADVEELKETIEKHRSYLEESGKLEERRFIAVVRNQAGGDTTGTDMQTCQLIRQAGVQ